jgi:predicted permease
MTLRDYQRRGERGTAVAGNAVSDVQYALRTFRKAPLASLTIVLTIAVGLGAVAVVFTLLNVLLFRTDIVPDVADMYLVQRPPQLAAELPPFNRARFEALRSETAVFSDAYAAVNEIDLRVDGRVHAVNLVSSGFFQAVRIRPVLGRVFDAADDDPAGGHPVLVLSDKGWERRFNRDPNVLGRTLLVQGTPFEIIGVMPEGFRGLEVGAPDAWAPLARLADFSPDTKGHEAKVPVMIVGRLAPGVPVASARAQLASWDANQAAPSFDRQTMTIELLPHRGTVDQPWEAIALFSPLFIAFGLILLIGCANVANLLLARGVARQKEIGIRLSLGASRRRIVRQLMTESMMLALAAAAGGYALSRLALQNAVAWALREMPTDLGDVNLGMPDADWRIAVFLAVAALAATALFALMPALQATGVEPVRTLRGELLREARPGRARNALIGVQVFASALLLICSAIFLRSTLESARYDAGLRTRDTILIDTINESKRAVMLQAMAAEPLLNGVAAVRPPMLAMPPRALADAGGPRTSVAYKLISGPYFDILGIPLLHGRTFTASEREDHPAAVVSESVARALWPDGNAVGKTFRIEPDQTGQAFSGFLQINPGERPAIALTPRQLTVVGVAKDVAGFRITDVEEAGVYLPTSLDAVHTSMVARVNGDPDLARLTLVEQLTRIDPNLDGITTMRTVARIETLMLRIAFGVSMILGSLALLLTVSGLFSVLSYLVEQRKREIGVRMALGASAQSVTRLMLSQTARPVLAGLIGGAALAAGLATAVMTTEVGAMISEIVRVNDPVAYASSLAVIVAACLLAAWIPASRAATVDPMQTLRQD